MIAAAAPIQRPHDAKLLIIDHTGEVRHHARSAFVNLLRAGDIVVANNAATLPASLLGVHIPTGCPIEVRLAGRGSLELREVGHFYAVVFGAGDFRMRTEDRPLPPALNVGEGLALGPLRSTVVRLLNHPRLVELRFEGSPREIWEGLARHGRPIQYSHIRTPLAVWDTWTAIAGPPVAFEPPSAGFILDWNVLASMTAHRIRFVTVTHAAGISSTGDMQLDALLPLNECYRIPLSTARVINEGRKRGARVIAIGTTVVRALEHAAAGSGAVRAGQGVATQRIGSSTLLRVVDAILTGTHEQGGSHYDLLSAFADEATLRRMDEELEQMNYRTHEFGDSVFLDKSVGMGTPGQPSEIAPACSSWSEIFGGLNLPLRRSVLMPRSISRLLAARRPAQPIGARRKDRHFPMKQNAHGEYGGKRPRCDQLGAKRASCMYPGACLASAANS